MLFKNIKIFSPPKTGKAFTIIVLPIVRHMEEYSMAAINDLIRQIEDKNLRDRLQQEVTRLSKQKKFGLVFEDHLPECTPLYGIPVRQGSLVAIKGEDIRDVYFVSSVFDDMAVIVNKATGRKSERRMDSLVAVAQFGEPIFPSLIPIDSVENAHDSKLWHTLIEADNFHALQLLEYLYPKQVDCIYIDPPYNTGARDWKYNNDYVDSSDSYRHSKWLSMMQKRLKIARRVLNPDTGVLIVTIDEHEVHHLLILLEKLFPEAYIQMVTIVINPKGSTRDYFSRVEEYAIYCFMPQATVNFGDDPMLGEKVSSKTPRWKGLLRSGEGSRREDSKNLFYPILIDSEQNRIVRAGDVVPYPETPKYGERIDGYDAAYPIRSDLTEGRWMLSAETFNLMLEKGYISLGKYDKKRKTWGISYLSKKPQKQIETGELIITGRDRVTGTVSVEYATAQEKQIKTVWHRTLHDAGAYGSDLVSNIIGQSRAFSFPKSLYAEHDSIKAVVKNNPNALILDFFSGSGTTLHAVNLLNAEDGGNRRCILVTNNECSDEDSKRLRAAGHQPGDDEWEKFGICRSVTWPRSKYSITGKRDDNTILDGKYYTTLSRDVEKKRAFFHIGFIDSKQAFSTAAKKQIVSLIGKEKIAQSLVKKDTNFIVSEKHCASIIFDTDYTEQWLEALEDQDHITDFYIVTEQKSIFNEIQQRVNGLMGPIITQEQLRRPMSDGFAANAEYFKLGFLDKSSVALGQQFREILPMLWLKAGAVGKRPVLADGELPNMLIPDGSNYAVLIDERYFGVFLQEIEARDGIEYVYLVTNSEDAYREMGSRIRTRNVTQLYRDYIDNFVINSRRI